LLENKYYVDDIYDTAVIQPILVNFTRRPVEDIDPRCYRRSGSQFGRTVVNFGKTARYNADWFGARVRPAIILAGEIIIIRYFAYNGAHVLQFVTNRSRVVRQTSSLSMTPSFEATGIEIK